MDYQDCRRLLSRRLAEAPPKSFDAYVDLKAFLERLLAAGLQRVPMPSRLGLPRSRAHARQLRHFVESGTVEEVVAGLRAAGFRSALQKQGRAVALSLRFRIVSGARTR